MSVWSVAQNLFSLTNGSLRKSPETLGIRYENILLMGMGVVIDYNHCSQASQGHCNLSA